MNQTKGKSQIDRMTPTYTYSLAHSLSLLSSQERIKKNF